MSSILSPFFCFVKTEIGNDDTDSANNLIAHQTAVNVNALSVSKTFACGKIEFKDKSLVFFWFGINTFVILSSKVKVKILFSQ